MAKYRFPYGRPYGHRYYPGDERLNQKKYQVLFSWGDIINDIPTSDLRGFEQDWDPKYYRVYDSSGNLVSPLNPDDTPYNKINEEAAVQLFLERRRS